MPSSAQRSHWFSYLATLAVALTVIAISIGTLGFAATGLTQRAERDKTALDLQIESAREIRAALKKPIVTPPLPPVTAKPARDVRAVAADQRRLPANARPAEAMNAMAMDQSGEARPSASYAMPDRHAVQ